MSKGPFRTAAIFSPMGEEKRESKIQMRLFVYDQPRLENFVRQATDTSHDSQAHDDLFWYTVLCNECLLTATVKYVQ